MTVLLWKGQSLEQPATCFPIRFRHQSTAGRVPSAGRVRRAVVRVSLTGLDFTSESRVMFTSHSRPMFTSHDRSMFTTHRRPVFTTVA
jgi:hypothetical protein